MRGVTQLLPGSQSWRRRQGGAR